MTIPRLSASHADWTVFAFTLAVSLINSILFGIAPALSSTRRSLATALRDSGTRGSAGGVRDRLRSALVIAEVALAVVLVVIGGLLTGSFVRLLRTNPGFQADRVLASIIVPSADRYKSSESRRAFFRRVLDSVRTLPGVESAGTVDALPFSGENRGGFISTGEGVVVQSGAQPIAETDLVSADYLSAMGARLLQGRWFRDEDVKQSHDVAIVSDAAANLLWPGTVALGKRICVNCTPDKPQQWTQVIGVVTNMRHSGLDEQGGAEVYLASGALEHAQFLVVRTSRPAGGLTKAIRSMIAAIDPNQPVFLSATMSSLIADSVADRRFIMTLLAITGLLALLLSAAGVYGVVSYSTSRRTHEIGVRMALGASPRQVHALIFAQGMRLAAIGAGIGLAVALALTSVLRTVLLGFQSSDPALVAIAVGLVIVVASIACWMPACLATRIDPMSALRQE
jgi:predicted permease